MCHCACRCPADVPGVFCGDARVTAEREVFRHRVNGHREQGLPEGQTFFDKTGKLFADRTFGHDFRLTRKKSTTNLRSPAAYREGSFAGSAT